MLRLERDLCVLHVGATADAEALETLTHAAKVIADLGAQQILIVLDEGGYGDPKAHAPPGIDVRPLRCTGLSTFGRIRALQHELSRVPEECVHAVHFHGVGPCLLGARALKGSPLHARAVYSPHLSHAASPFAAAVLRRLLQSRLDAKACAAVTASPTDAHLLSRLLDRSTEVLPQPVAQVYFTARQESARPRILAAGIGDEAFDVVSRLCVLLNGREARVGFAWLGTAPADKRAQLEAAGVEVLALEQDADRAAALSRASAFIYVSSGNRMPLAVAQAMAAGVPCLVSNTPAHRALVCHGETGFVCTSERDFLDKLVLLLRERAERRYIGEAARAEAARRFTLRHFERALLRAYGLTAGLTAGFPRGALAPVAVLPVRGTQARA